jgi:hypothetical protein
VRVLGDEEALEQAFILFFLPFPLPFITVSSSYIITTDSIAVLGKRD